MTIIEAEEPICSEMEPPPTSFIADPVFADTVEVEYDHPVCGPPTEDPNRYTVHVPFDGTVLSLGKECSRWIFDEGITGRTEKHIHWHVAVEDKTMVSLGGPATEGFAGHKGNILGQSTGYTMVTEGASWNDAKEQMYLVSRDEDVIVRAPKADKKVLVQADEGSVFVGGGKGVVIGGKNEVSIYADTSYENSDAEYKGEVTEAIEKKYHKGWTQWATSAFDWAHTIAGIIGTVASVAHERKEALKHQKGWKVKSLAEFGEIGVELGKLIYSVKKGTQAHETPGSVSIHAEHEIGLAAGGVLELFGRTGAGLSSPAIVDVIGGAVGVKAATFASVWAGVNASLTGGKEATVSGRSEVRIRSKKEVNITGGDEVKIGAGKIAVMSAETEYAVVFGKEWVYCAAEGYGMKAKEHSLAIGKMSSPGDYTSAAADDKSIMKMEDTIIEITNNGGGIKLMNGNCEMSNSDSASMQMNGGQVHIVANGKILLG